MSASTISASGRRPADPAISVVIPTYNRAHLVTRAIESALAAISPGDEVVLVDDGSTDQTESVVRKHGQAVRYLKTEHRGAGAARNRGVREAAHDWVAFLDSDDEWTPDHLRIHRRLMSACRVLFCFSNFDVCYDGEPERPMRRMQLLSWSHDLRDWSEIIGRGAPYSQFAELPAGRADFNVHIGSIYRTMLRCSYVSAVASLIRRELAAEMPWFPEDLPTFEDYEYFIRLSRQGLAAYLDCSTAINHGHRGSRLTGAHDLTKADVRTAILKRTYGADDAFLRDNRVMYEAALREMRDFRVRELLRRGRVEEASGELRASGRTALARVVGLLPGVLLRTLWSVWRGTKRVWRRAA